ncbi:hypothetical protein GIB67_013963 [Kingdonia uniflora]|uniref:Uncharacterized protein n=1 Tax=Kingdonia uniflora TaxID=39325 RepID=A0A7J7LDQ5_9MAGN|nr:hypothetical protein GIB67_013963 [Kingdonia uniflora]
MVRFHYLLTSEAEHRNGLQLLAEEAVTTEDKAASIRPRESCRYPTSIGLLSCGLGFAIVAGIGFDCGLRLLEDLGVRRVCNLGFAAFAIIAGVGFDGGGVVWVVAMAAVLRLGCSVIWVACPRDAVVRASGYLLGLILLEHCIGL